MYSTKTLANNLKEHLASRGIEQKWVATQLNTTSATLSRYVSGERVPPVDTLVELARVLNVSVDYLLGVEPPAKTRTPADISILTDCFEIAPMPIRKIIWSALDPYMTPDQRIVIEAGMSVEEKETAV